MIEYIEGNIFDSPAQVIVNTVNTVGVMGKGIALSYKKKYPEMFDAYRKACDKHQLVIGKLMIYYAPDHWILLFPTKENWRNPSKLEYIEKGLNKFVRTYADKGITSIAFPKLGCGNGELNWDDVRLLMEKYLKPLPIKVYIYLGWEFSDVPEHKKEHETMQWLRQNAKDMSFRGLCDDLKHGQSILPYEVIYSDIKYEISWKNGLVCKNDTDETTISEDELFEMWDQIRSQWVFIIDANKTKEGIFYQLLQQLGYLTPIRVLDGQSNTMKKGYQTNEGLGRVFALRGEQ